VSLNPKQNGFTLVELVVIIIILAIVSLYASSKYIGVNKFSSFAAQEQAIAVIRQIQLGRMQSNSATISDEYRLQVTSNCLGSVATCGSGNTEVRSNAVWIEEQSFSFSPSMVVDFDFRGNPVCTGACAEPITISIQNSSAIGAAICINGQGFVYDC
jgi:MSHA pilin protein MshC